ncbi:MAG: ACP S-malonyltransferase [Acidobacteriota bacterium]|nr:ACP S-malonyltransferase [Acidobacteriota bacterium]MDQ7086754.1 ACP S-malonyltransferase [Acidobacteriota bacterium]
MVRYVALFPGQGSQSVGMGRELAEAYPESAAVFSLADEVLGERLSALCFEGPEEALRLTRNTQPALLTVSTAAWAAWSKRSSPPAAAAGHSLGEYSALVAAGVLPFADALRAVRLRGEAMQEAVPLGTGSMAALIGADDSAVEQLCRAQRREGEVLVPANFNAPGQVVIAGHHDAVARAVEAAPEAGVRRAVPLPVSAPFHCPLMLPAQQRLAAFLETLDFRDPAFPVLANVDAAPVVSGEQARAKLIEQVSSPVLWARTMQALGEDYEASLGVEIGAGRVLAGLARKIPGAPRVLAAGTPEAIDKALAAL